MCKMIFIVVLFVVAMASANHQSQMENYWTEREIFIQDERNMSLGASVVLNEKERRVNHLLMKYKKKEFEDGFHNPVDYPPAMHFFHAKKYLDKSLVFTILKQMPKGAILHAHDFAFLDADWIMRNVTYRENLYANQKDGKWNFLFTNKPQSGWQSVAFLRNKSTPAVFDKWLKSHLTLEVPNPEEKYTDINSIWESFMDIFMVITPMLTYKPVFEDYIYEILEQSYNNNVMYIEMRGTLPDIYELSGSAISGTDSVYLMEDINKKFLEGHPDHMGMKFIFAPVRRVENTTMVDYISQFKLLKETHPNFIAGFDLVGQEDLGKPLCEFINELRNCTPDTKFFFHAGETDWYGMPTDKNLIDAVLLNTTRIGHGYAIVKHPKVMEEVKKRDIAIEINPISNQVLMLVKDIRNHPASILLSQNFPVVISCDDPGYWGANFLDHDFYFAFMGLASAEDDLRFIKQLALNSLKYSVFTQEERNKAFEIFNQKWETFLTHVLEQYNRHNNTNNNVE